MKNLVKISRLESGAIQFQTKPCCLKPTLSETVQEVYHLAREKEISIVLEEFEDRKVLQNRRWTREVFVNILENALKYSPSHTKIGISVKCRHYGGVSWSGCVGEAIPPGYGMRQCRHIFDGKRAGSCA